MLDAGGVKKFLCTELRRPGNACGAFEISCTKTLQNPVPLSWGNFGHWVLSDNSWLLLIEKACTVATPETPGQYQDTAVGLR